LNLKCDILVS
jgi:hypothetical protein